MENSKELFKKLDSQFTISSLGNLYKNGKLRKPYPMIKKAGQKYLIVTMGAKRYALASLVAKHFVANPDRHRNLGFKDRDRMNCEASNLYWMSDKAFYKYCRLDAHQSTGRKKKFGDRLDAITRCQCYLLREYYITLNEEWIRECFDVAWRQIRFYNRHKLKDIIYEYFHDRAKRFSLTYRPVTLIILYRRTAWKIWREENNYPKHFIQYNENQKAT